MRAQPHLGRVAALPLGLAGTSRGLLTLRVGDADKDSGLLSPHPDGGGVEVGEDVGRVDQEVSEAGDGRAGQDGMFLRQTAQAVQADQAERQLGLDELENISVKIEMKIFCKYSLVTLDVLLRENMICSVNL